MSQRTLSILMLLAVVFGGAARFSHEWAAARDVAPAGLAADSHHDGDAPADHSHHDHEHCAVCQMLAAPRIDRLPGTLIIAAPVDLPRRGPAPRASLPHRVLVPALTLARAPPGAARA